MAKLFHGDPRLLYVAVPAAAVVVALKSVMRAAGWEPLEFSPLLTGVIAAEVFIVGFLLTGTAADFKEAEHLPSEIATSLESMADECLVAFHDTGLAAARSGLAQIVEIGASIRAWLAADRGLDDVLTEIRALNGVVSALAASAQPGALAHLKSEQSAVRGKVLRIDTMRRTSYVSAAYLVGEIIGVLLIAVMLVTEIGAAAPTLCVVGLIAFLLFYLFSLIRNLDNPFEYPNGRPGPADVSVDVLDRTEDRLTALLAALPAPAVVVAVEPAVLPPAE